MHIREITPDEFPRFVEMVQAAAGHRADDRVVRQFEASYSNVRTLAAFDGDALVGGTGSEPLELTLPGPVVTRAQRITHTGVVPTHRRRGVALSLLARQLRDLRRQGERLAMFTTNGPGVYREIGYSPSSWMMQLEGELAEIRLRSEGPAPGSVRTLAPAELERWLPAVFEPHRAAQVGQVQRTDRFWDVWLRDGEHNRPVETGPRFAVAALTPRGAPGGYATYRFVRGHHRDRPVERIWVEEVVSLDAVSARELNSFLLGFRQARHILFPHLAVDTPLRAMLKDPRTLRCTAVRDFLWMRILDVEAALPLRRYGTGATLVLDVRDVTLPENAGRYRLSHEAGGPVCGVTTQAADLSLDVADLAAAYLGGTSFTTLAAAGLVEEHTSGALTRADALFAADRQPWTVSDW